MKLKIIIPSILLVPCLFGCKNKNAYSFVFSSDYCSLNNKNEYAKEEDPEPITLTMTLNEGYEYCNMPDDIVVMFGNGKGTNGAEYVYTVNDDKTATITLKVVNNITVYARFSDSDNAFTIAPDKYEEALLLTDSDLEYVQKACLRGYAANYYINVTYSEDYVSPTVYDHYQRRIYGDPSPSDTDEFYVEKASNKYFRYSRASTSSPWTKSDSSESAFPKPSDISTKYDITLENIPYDEVKNKYDKSLQGYSFEKKIGDYDYSIFLSFYNNRLTYFSYSYYDGISTTKFCMSSYTYTSITPKLPEVHE